ncbi:MAG: hypothetical protein KF895_01205 [Parvibaculum sp.]|nr:hypothetical protein [Parvibaculum sp.]
MLESTPWGGKHSFLWRLRYEVGDDHLERVLSDFSTIIRRSERRCENAEAQGGPEYRDLVGESEGEYIEEIIGACVLVSQAKIRRVTSAALKLGEIAKNKLSISISEFGNAEKILGIGEMFKGTNSTAVELMWDLGNYYKHCDEWPSQVWENLEGRFKKQRATRVSVERLGISRGSTGNMRNAFKFFSGDQHLDCSALARLVNNWAVVVNEIATSKIEAAERAR